MFKFVKNIFTFIKRKKQDRPSSVSLSIDDVDVIAEALSVYEAGLVGKRFGYFSHAAKSAKAKILAVYPDLFQQFTNPR